MTTKTIRGFKEGDWAEIKAMASREGIPISKLIVKATKELRGKKAKDAWEKILSVKPDPKLAEEIEKSSKELRAGFRLREFK
ncbi:hypothetical protein HYY72_03870 [Candidatus Woesearchaeota archaeon]|nr:hypothetical protein [Candidatus Woesearchaeota archaeon]